MSLPAQFSTSAYNTLTDAEKARVRDQVFEYIVSQEARLARSQADGTTTMGNIDALAAFVVAIAADFSASERTDLGTARDRLRQRVADYANGISGVSGATVA